MKVITDILNNCGIESAEELDTGRGFVVKSEGFMDLTIEKITENHLIVAHYYKQEGDLMSDPQIVFDISGDEWPPIEFRTDPYTHDRDEDGLNIGDFVDQWNQNLRAQGFVENSENRSMVKYLDRR